MNWGVSKGKCAMRGVSQQPAGIVGPVKPHGSGQAYGSSLPAVFACSEETEVEQAECHVLT